jgi:hypothetical protein
MSPGKLTGFNSPRLETKSDIDEVVAVPAPFVAVTVNVVRPVVRGVPERVPFVARVSPAGNSPVATANVGVGVPVATNV